MSYTCTHSQMHFWKYKILRSNNYIIRTATTLSTVILQSILEEGNWCACSKPKHHSVIQWYPKFTGISSFRMLVISCGRQAGYMLALSRQWHADLLLVLKFIQGFEFECWNEPEVLSNMNWPWRMQLMCLKLYPNASTFAQPHRRRMRYRPLSLQRIFSQVKAIYFDIYNVIRLTVMPLWAMVYLLYSVTFFLIQKL